MEENKDFKEELETKVEENKEIERQNISINLKKDEILIKISAEASHDDIIEEIFEAIRDERIVFALAIVSNDFRVELEPKPLLSINQKCSVK